MLSLCVYCNEKVNVDPALGNNFVDSIRFFVFVFFFYGAYREVIRTSHNGECSGMIARGIRQKEMKKINIKYFRPHKGSVTVLVQERLRIG